MTARVEFSLNRLLPPARFVGVPPALEAIVGAERQAEAMHRDIEIDLVTALDAAPGFVDGQWHPHVRPPEVGTFHCDIRGWRCHPPKRVGRKPGHLPELGSPASSGCS